MRIALVAVWVLGGMAQAETLSLSNALREALDSHPSLEIAGARVAVAEGQVRQSGVRPNPLFIYQSEDFRAWQSPAHRFWQGLRPFLLSATGV